jgi:hypothetical protein
MENLMLIVEGEVEYLLKYELTPYYKQEKGSFFGLEDYIYRLPDETRHELNDQVYFFSDYSINIWFKRKFKVRTRCKTTVYTLDLYSLFPECQRRFPRFANSFFAYSIKNFANLLYCKQKVSAKLLNLKEEVDCWDSKFRTFDFTQPAIAKKVVVPPESSHTQSNIVTPLDTDISDEQHDSFDTEKSIEEEVSTSKHAGWFTPRSQMTD